MATRKKILFKVNDIVMVEELRDLSIEEVNNLKVIVAQECDCTPEDVEVDTQEAEIIMSDFDITKTGMVDFRSLYPNPVIGSGNFEIDENSDKFITLMQNYIQNKDIDKIAESLSFFTDNLA
jgi:hypothetical protein